MVELELFASGYCKWRTQHTACVFQHEIDLLGCYFLSGYDKVALVLAVFVIDYDYKASFAEIGDCLVD